ncbi:hypothetical protein CesoFtcFv8_003756 [Champsocephalus esox]|uniref:Uncharacterized protein n=1 Tax=Champsocephalus esox TaxID=159716 RepID=A0AAN8CVK2_9TELE|nr:hypothetical protein CesoFtcFv8_003756 [Champsocephalus esox]
MNPADSAFLMPQAAAKRRKRKAKLAAMPQCSSTGSRSFASILDYLAYTARVQASAPDLTARFPAPAATVPSQVSSRVPSPVSS